MMWLSCYSCRKNSMCKWLVKKAIHELRIKISEILEGRKEGNKLRWRKFQEWITMVMLTSININKKSTVCVRWSYWIRTDFTNWSNGGTHLLRLCNIEIYTKEVLKQKVLTIILENNVRWQRLIRWCKQWSFMFQRCPFNTLILLLLFPPVWNNKNICQAMIIGSMNDPDKS